MSWFITPIANHNRLGFVQSDIVKNSVTGDTPPVENREAKMTAERCAYLTMKSVVNE